MQKFTLTHIACGWKRQRRIIVGEIVQVFGNQRRPAPVALPRGSDRSLLREILELDPVALGLLNDG
jgi:hypothetical protein